jgi:DNA polymerase III subunit chi
MMTEVHFYHLTRKTLEQTLPDLLEKTLAREWRAVVMVSSPERAEALAQMLWTYRPDGFLPHGSAKDGMAAEQLVWLTDQDERPNGAQVLFLADGASSAQLGDYQRVCDIFDGVDDAAVAAARARWQQYKQSGFTVNYWQQADKGWVNQAAA